MSLQPWLLFLHVTGGTPGEASVLLRRWLVGYGAVLFILVSSVWDMIFKPFT